MAARMGPFGPQPGRGAIAGQLDLPEKSQREGGGDVDGLSVFFQHSQEDKGGTPLQGCANGLYFSKVGQAEK